MKSVMCVSAAFLAAGAASAQDLHLAVKIFNGMSWVSNTGFVLPGSTFEVGIWMSGDTSVYGMGGATLRLSGTGLAASDGAEFWPGDTTTGRVAPFDYGPATNAIFRDGPSTFRIDAASDAADSADAGMNFFQRDPALATPGTFSTANPALCFRFLFRLSAENITREIHFSLDQLAGGVASYYTAANARRAQSAAVTLESGTILVAGIPTPGSLALFGVLAAMGGRRRRSV